LLLALVRVDFVEKFPMQTRKKSGDWALFPKFDKQGCLMPAHRHKKIGSAACTALPNRQYPKLARSRLRVVWPLVADNSALAVNTAKSLKVPHLKYRIYCAF
jgi:hypothetical protein